MIPLLKTSLVKLWHSALVSPFFSTLAFIITPIKLLLESEKDFFVMLTMAIIIDLIVGIMKYIKLHKFSFKDMVLGLIVKVVVGYGGMMLFLAFASLEDGWVSEWFLLMAKFTILLYPAGSTLANMYVLTDKRFPPISFMKRLKAFDAVLTPSVIREIKNEDENE